MTKYRSDSYKVGDLVTILRATNSGNLSQMKDMVGKVFPIESIPDHSTCIINDYFWSFVDIKKFHPEKPSIKSEKFDVNNLIIEE